MWSCGFGSAQSVSHQDLIPSSNLLLSKTFSPFPTAINQSTPSYLPANEETQYPSFHLINIPKIQILLIRQIPKRSRIQIPPLQPALHRALQRIPALVLPRQDEA
jgi:hypothetical protein